MTTDSALSTPTLADLADRIDSWSMNGLRALDSTTAWLPWTTVAVSAAYTFGPFDRIVLANATGGAFTVTLPAAAYRKNGQPLTVIRTNAGANAITIATLGGTINGAVTVTLAVQYDSHTFVSDGTNWWIVTDALTGAVPSGNAGGDLSGTYPNPGVVQAAKLTTARTINGTSFDGSRTGGCG